MYVIGNGRQFDQWAEEGENFRKHTKPQDVQEKPIDHSWFKLDNDGR